MGKKKFEALQLSDQVMELIDDLISLAEAEAEATWREADHVVHAMVVKLTYRAKVATLRIKKPWSPPKPKTVKRIVAQNVPPATFTVEEYRGRFGDGPRLPQGMFDLWEATTLVDGKIVRPDEIIKR